MQLNKNGLASIKSYTDIPAKINSMSGRTISILFRGLDYQLLPGNPEFKEPKHE